MYDPKELDGFSASEIHAIAMGLSPMHPARYEQLETAYRAALKREEAADAKPA